MEKNRHTVGSENVFADLGIDEPEEYLQKADLAVRINDILSEQGLNQKTAADKLGIDQPKISLLKRGLLDGFSIERLLKFLRLLGHAHEIVPKQRLQFTGVWSSHVYQMKIERSVSTSESAFKAPYPAEIADINLVVLGQLQKPDIYGAKMSAEKKKPIPSPATTTFSLSPDFRSLYSNNATCEVSVFDVRITFGESSKSGEESMNVDQRVAVVMSPQHAKVFANLLLNNIQAYEQKIGAIALPPPPA